ncbi:MAG: hypothetical protein WB755_07705 [Terriglobales bacterium]|jgi:hypothetical protein
MNLVEELDTVTIERLRKQGEFLRRIYRAEFAKDPTSQATESSRSNVLAMQHTVRQMYGEAVARDVANLVTATQESVRNLGQTIPFRTSAT